jgi:hypothetical protein
MDPPPWNLSTDSTLITAALDIAKLCVVVLVIQFSKHASDLHIGIKLSINTEDVTDC